MSREPPDESPWLIDFFEEGETHENAAAPESEGPAPGRAPRSRPARRGPTSEGRARAGRLALAVAAVLVLAVVLIVVLSGGSESGSDSAYLARVAVPAQDSQSVGTALGRLLGSSPASEKGLERTLGGLLSRQERDLSEVAAISPPPRLRSEQQQAVSAMQFRVGGLSGLLRGFREAAARPTGVDWAAQLSIQADRLLTSDVIWSEFFVSPAQAQAAADGARAASAPGSTFISDANLTAPEAMATVLADLQGRATTGGASGGVIRLGSKGAAVKAWQQQLNVWIAQQPGLKKLKLTGTFDQATQTATMAFQTAAKITADGVVGPMTRAALVSALGQGG